MAATDPSVSTRLLGCMPDSSLRQFFSTPVQQGGQTPTDPMSLRMTAVEKAVREMLTNMQDMHRTQQQQQAQLQEQRSLNKDQIEALRAQILQAPAQEKTGMEVRLMELEQRLKPLEAAHEHQQRKMEEKKMIDTNPKFSAFHRTFVLEMGHFFQQQRDAATNSKSKPAGGALGSVCAGLPMGVGVFVSVALSAYSSVKARKEREKAKNNIIRSAVPMSSTNDVDQINDQLARAFLMRNRDVIGKCCSLPLASVWMRTPCSPGSSACSSAALRRHAAARAARSLPAKPQHTGLRIVNKTDVAWCGARVVRRPRQSRRQLSCQHRPVHREPRPGLYQVRSGHQRRRPAGLHHQDAAVR